MKKEKVLLFVSAAFIFGAVGYGIVKKQQTTNVKTSVGQEEQSTDLFTFAQTEYDFGVIKQSGGKVQHEFAFTYNGEEPIQITGIPTSCACTSAQIDNTDLRSGDTGILTVTFNPNLHEEPEGRFFKTITLFTDPELDNLPEIKMWAEIDLDLGPEAFELQSDHEDEPGEEENDGLTSYTSITPEKLADMLEEKDFTLIDVHIPEQQHIEGTDAFIPYNSIEGSVDLPKDKDAKIVLYCRSGGMSRAAAYTLVEEGYTNVYDLSGGVNAYNKFLESQVQDQEAQASEKIGYIEFDAMTVTQENKERIASEYVKELSGVSIDSQKTNILLVMNNHRISLGDFDYKSIVALDGIESQSWQQLSEEMGGHHISGMLTFSAQRMPQVLTIEGLPVGEVTLPFTQV